MTSPWQMERDNEVQATTKALAALYQFYSARPEQIHPQELKIWVRGMATDPIRYGKQWHDLVHRTALENPEIVEAYNFVFHHCNNIDVRRQIELPFTD